MAISDTNPLSHILSGPGQTIGEGMSSRVQCLNVRVTSLYEEHRDRIYRFLVSQSLPPSIAQEVAQDVFVKLFIALQRGSEIASERSWLYSVAAKSAVDYWRREGKPVWVEFDPGSPLAGTLASVDPGPEAATIENERLVRAASALHTLPREQRLCVRLRSEGLRYKEIADILGVAVSTIADWLSTAVERLRGAAHD